jgi:hypothetical protein
MGHLRWASVVLLVAAGWCICSVHSEAIGYGELEVMTRTSNHC